MTSDTTAAYRLNDWIRNRHATDIVSAESLDRIAADVAEVLAENTGLCRLADGRGSIGMAANAFSDGWYSALAAVSHAGGWDEREQAWRKYREQMTETLVKADAERMPSRAELDKFIAPEGRRLVDEFVAGCASEDNDFDVSEALNRNLDEAVAGMVGLDLNGDPA